jgi:hypothetical protein
MKTYSNKSNAKRAAIRMLVKDRSLTEAAIKGDEDKFFTIEGDKENGFYPHFNSDRVGVVSEEKEVELKEERALHVQQVGRATRKPAPVEVTDMVETGKGIKIEKDRPEQNGIVRPSVGGKCRQVWDFCDSVYAGGQLPMPKQMREWAREVDVNENNAVIEMYQWRKFHGINGRQK